MENNRYLDCPKNIYIISTISYTLSLKSALHCFQLQKQLENIGFTIVNPIEIFMTEKEISYTYNVRNKLKKLINCDWVYIMPDVSLQSGSNTEVRISLELDMKIIQGDILNICSEELV
jgi:hypothetical protein